MAALSFDSLPAASSQPAASGALTFDHLPDAPTVAFGSNRGVAPTNDQMRQGEQDFGQGITSGIKESPFWLNDMTNAMTQGITRMAGATQDNLTPEQAEGLTNPKGIAGSNEILQGAGVDNPQPKTGLGIFGQLLGQAGGMGGIEASAPLVDAAAGKIGDAAMSVPEGIGLRARGALAKDIDAREAQSEAFSNDTSAAYKAFDDTGARLTDKSANDLNNAVRQSYADIKIDPVASPKTVSALKNIYQRITQGKVDPITGDVSQEPLSVGEVDQYRRQLARASYGEDTAAASAARNAIDNHLNNLDESDFVGGDSDNAINKLNAARDTAAKEFKFNDLLDIQKKADGDSNAIKRLLTKYLDKNPNGLSDDELDLYKRAAERSPAEALERALGTFGLDFGKVKNVALPVLSGASSTLLPGVGLPLSLVGTATRQTAKWAGRGALEDAMNAIAKRDTSVKPPPPAPPPAPPMLALPAPKTTVYGNTVGQNVPLSEAGRESIGQQEATHNPASGLPQPVTSPSEMLQQYGNARLFDADKLPPIIERPSNPGALGNAAYQAQERLNAKNRPVPPSNESPAPIPSSPVTTQPAVPQKANSLPYKDYTAEAQKIVNTARATGNPIKNEDMARILGAALKNRGATEGQANAVIAAILAGTAAGAGALMNQQPATSGIGQQNMQELQKMKPQSANPNVQSFAKAESGGNPNAKNPNSSASGLYQFTNKTWADMVLRHGKETGIGIGDKANPQAQAIMASLYAKDNIPVLAKTLGRMPTVPELYQAHIFGAHGATRLLSANPGQEAITLFPRNVIDANRSVFYEKSRPRTVAEVKQFLSSKVA